MRMGYIFITGKNEGIIMRITFEILVGEDGVDSGIEPKTGLAREEEFGMLVVVDVVLFILGGS